MINFLIFLPIAVIYLSFKTTVAPSIPLPDITLLIVLFIAHDRASVDGVFLGFVLGYVNDVFAGGVLGASSFSLVFAYMLVYLASGRLRFTATAVTACAAFVLAVINGTLQTAVLRFADMSVPFGAQMLLTAIVTGLFAPVFIPFFSRLRSFAAARLKRGVTQ